MFKYFWNITLGKITKKLNAIFESVTVIGHKP